MRSEAAASATGAITAPTATSSPSGVPAAAVRKPATGTGPAPTYGGRDDARPSEAGRKATGERGGDGSEGRAGRPTLGAGRHASPSSAVSAVVSRRGLTVGPATAGKGTPTAPASALVSGTATAPATPDEATAPGAATCTAGTNEESHPRALPKLTCVNLTNVTKQPQI